MEDDYLDDITKLNIAKEHEDEIRELMEEHGLDEDAAGRVHDIMEKENVEVGEAIELEEEGEF